MMASFKGFLLILGVLFAIVRISSVESPSTSNTSNSAFKSNISSDEGLNGKPDFEGVTNVKPSQSSAPTSSASSSAVASSFQDSKSSESSSTHVSTISTSLSGTASSLSQYSMSTTELELLVTPTVAPATPHEDLETISPSLAVLLSSTVRYKLESQAQDESRADQGERALENGVKVKENGIKTPEKTQRNAKAEHQVVDGVNDVAERTEKEALENVSATKTEKPVETSEKVEEVTRLLEGTLQVKEAGKEMTRDGQQPEIPKEHEVASEFSDSGKEIVPQRPEMEQESPLEDKEMERKKEANEKSPPPKEKETTTAEPAPTEVKTAEKVEEQPKDKQEETPSKEKEKKTQQSKEKEKETQQSKEKEKETQQSKEKQEETQESKGEESQETKDKEEDSITAGLKQAEEETKSSSEDMPSFDEFKRQLLQEEEQKTKLEQQKSEQHKENVPKPKPRKVKQRKQNNYASLDCGAKIVKVNEEASNPFSILQENRDIYMLNPCSAKIWFVVELCDTVQVKTIEIANFELFSSTPESFRVYVSGRYPTRDWAMLGTFQARDQRDVQSFPLEEPVYAKYLKVEMLTHFGSEHYCPLSLLRVFGTSMVEELEDHEAGSQDDTDPVDQDDDAVPVLPPDPSAKIEEAPTQPNILATVGDTLFNMVKEAAKKISGVIKEGNRTKKDSDSNEKRSEPDEKPKDKQSIVTLIPSEEEDKPHVLKPDNRTSNISESKTDERTSGSPGDSDSASKDSRDDNKFCKRVDDDSTKGSKSTSAFTNCDLFVKMIGHSSLGCFMGHVLYSKKSYQNLTALEETAKARTKQKAKLKVAVSVAVPKKADQKTESEGDEKRKEDDKKEEKNEKKLKEREEKQKRSPDVPSEDSKRLSKEDEISKGPQEQIHEERKYAKNETERNKVHPSLVIQPSETQPIIDSDTNSHEVSTPLLPSLSSLTTSSDVQESSSTAVTTLDNTSTQNTENTAANGGTDSMNGSGEERRFTDDKVQSSGDSKPDLAQKTSSSESLTGGTCTGGEVGDHAHAVAPSKTSHSECKAPTHVPHPQDVDILEIKLDREGKEGTAHPEKPMGEETPAGEKEGEDANEALNGASGPPSEDAKATNKDSKTSTENKQSSETTSEVSSSTMSSGSLTTEKRDTISSSKVETDIPTVKETPALPIPAKVPPTRPPKPEYPDQQDSVAPLPPPPLAGEQSVDTVSTIEASLADDATLSSVLSKVASISAGQGLTGGAQKESVLMRLTNRIKALQQNLTLSTMYMEKLNQKYRKIVEEMQKNFDKKVNLLTNATRKAEAVIKNQKEQISKLQGKMDSMANNVDKITRKVDNLNKEVMERHIIGLFLEVILIMILFVVFRRWDRARLRREAAREALVSRELAQSPHYNRPPLYTEEQAKEKNVNGKLSARERLLRSYSVPEIVGSLTETIEDPKTKEPYVPQEVKKKKHKKRKGAVTSDSLPVTTTRSTDTSHASLVSRTAGLLFSPARGLLNGLSDSWKWKPVTTDDSELRSTNPQANGRLHNLTKSKSLDVVPEEPTFTYIPPPPPPPKKGRIPTPPPPPDVPKSWKKASTNCNNRRLPGQPPTGVPINRKGRGGGYGNQFA